MKKILACMLVLSFMAVAAGCATSDEGDGSGRQTYEGVRPSPTKIPR